MNYQVLPGNMSAENVSEAAEEESISDLQWTTFGQILPAVCVVGIVGNCLNLLVLTRHNRRYWCSRQTSRSTQHGATRAMYLYLHCMALSDLLAMVTILVKSLNWSGHLAVRDTHLAYYFHHVSPVVENTFLVSSAFMVLSITVERYLAVCHPHKCKLFHAWHLHNWIIISAYLLAFLVNLPVAFQFDTRVMCDSNETAHRYQRVLNPAYAANAVFFKWLRAAIDQFLPIVGVTVLNVLTLRQFRRLAIRRTTSKSEWSCSVSEDASRQQLRHSRHGSQSSMCHRHLFRREQRLMILLVCVAVIYVVCLCPMAVVHLLYSSNNLKKYSFQVLRAAANVLEATNSAINFYIYCLASKDFRHQFRSTMAAILATVCPWCRCQWQSARREVDETTAIRPQFTTVVVSGLHDGNGNERRKVSLADIGYVSDVPSVGGDVRRSSSSDVSVMYAVSQDVSDTKNVRVTFV